VGFKLLESTIACFFMIQFCLPTIFRVQGFAYLCLLVIDLESARVNYSAAAPLPKTQIKVLDLGSKVPRLLCRGTAHLFPLAKVTTTVVSISHQCAGNIYRLLRIPSLLTVFLITDPCCLFAAAYSLSCVDFSLLLLTALSTAPSLQPPSPCSSP
jgi:hypothetical protein